MGALKNIYYVGNLDKLAVKCCAVGCLNTEAQDGESNTPGEKKIKNLLVCSKCRVAKYCSKVFNPLCVLSFTTAIMLHYIVSSYLLLW